MNLTLEALQILDAIERKGSFAAAAAALDKVPSAITYSIRKLEEDLDVLLYDRRGHRAKLTIAGQELLLQGRHLLNAAQELENRVKRAASGWEAELRIVLDGVIAFDDLLPLIKEFEQQACGTRLRISQEILSGVWESMVSGRADLAIGAAFDGPEAIRTQGEFHTRVLGSIDWVFAVAPQHPLAHASEPLTHEMIQTHRAIAVGDTGLDLPSMTAGLLRGQDTLTVPSIAAKLSAQLAGLGCGHLPRRLALPHLNNGSLVEKQTEGHRLIGSNRIVWRSSNRGKALHWFLQKLQDPVVQRMLLGN
ncbi:MULTISPECIES: LysR family transcriptional regulator [unclassified Undibacterium]|uniref:LysR family transcriptional regulator n=1 Tax=unclassified Undibacterium TaxID=2630295 RepID=UPI002AC94B47|nr:MULTISPECIES: LysR family transcriptional regulator [unclassified Undibacterium]MEB0139589.1 LysR family transcriptional regulator [Undibacterium sp. CCC2.1]MEB0172480.1 LysR family transcriptional regulator [Undibacterium sp. CCC1.1]MEB0176498.1 LysR family transcriptional regulator [Undibacterium sp. CCC3.4]MEB0215648.1 LysR family transcriptional regulator [Undibacterium sp. 5I2]WPX43956.1 LysR family transcriptional regulator [Undibacterium sp. CCC3.4]